MFRIYLGSLFLVSGLFFVPTHFFAQSSQEPNSQVGESAAKAAPAQATPELDQAAKLIVKLGNQFRAEQKREALSENAQLTATAREFARYMAQTDQFSHTADGNEPWERAGRHGYEYCIVLENIAWEVNSEGFTSAALAEALMNGWKQSPGHRKNLLDKDVTETGVGVAHSAESGRYYAVQMFGRPKSAAIAFQVTNHSSSAVKLTVDSKEHTVPPRVTMTFTRCRPPTLTFTEQNKEFHPTNGASYVVEEGEDGGYQVQETAMAKGQ